MRYLVYKKSPNSGLNLTYVDTVESDLPSTAAQLAADKNAAGTAQEYIVAPAGEFRTFRLKPKMGYEVHESKAQS
jgi:hypothetical protein